MAVKTKSREAADKAAKLRAEAQSLRSKLVDLDTPLSKDEIVQIEEQSKALEMRAAAIANFTPDEEIEDQGTNFDLSTGELRSAPHREEEKKARSYADRVTELRNEVTEVFGGQNGLVLALAQSQGNVRSLTTRQARVVAALKEMAQRTITAQDGNASNAEVLLPLQQETSIFQVPVEVAGIISSARRFAVRGRQLYIPYLKQTDATTSNRPMAGIADVQIVGEAGLKTEFEPKFDQRLLTVFKYAGYTEIADETLADDMTGELAPTVQNVIGGQIMNKVNEDLTFDGTGSSQPLGAFNDNNPSLYKVARKTTGTFKVEDVFNMYSRHVMGPQSAWYIHPSVVPQLFNMSLAGTTLVSYVTNLQGRPQMQLLGLPIIVTPLMKVLGLEGDVGLANGAFYAMALRQALTIESSIHYKFRNDITAYRFYMRAGGIPIPDGTYSYKAAGSVKEWVVSPFIVLDDVQAA
jgi:HK97 family phage major capsid protein